jgi:hypothetical protein
VGEAEYALLRAESLFRPAPVRARFGRVAPARRLDATLILRDLSVRAASLPMALRARARQVLARPTDGDVPPGTQSSYGSNAEQAPVCAANTCVHYVITGRHRPEPADTSPANGVPDYVDLVSQTVEDVWQSEVTAQGFRAPKSDLSSTNNGGDARLDVYVADVGNAGLYGFCTSDDPHLFQPSYRFFDFSAYCVVDNDFSQSQFPVGAYGTAALQVTTAHEFFHAVQASYDWFEDVWLLESTAVWMEDVVYDSVNDNLQYLPFGPLGKPRVPLDRGAGLSPYGSWIFWVFLVDTAYFDAGAAGVVRDVWDYADGSAGGPDLYSTQAAAAAIGDRQSGGENARFRAAFAAFGAANAAPRQVYPEGQANAYPTPEPAKRKVFTGNSRTLPPTSIVLDHLANAYVVARRGAGVGASAKLRIHLNGPPFTTGTEASAVLIGPGGIVSSVRLSISSNGDATRNIQFGSGINKVVIVVTNASRRFASCYRNFTDWSCSGVPRDDDLPFLVSATVV